MLHIHYHFGSGNKKKLNIGFKIKIFRKSSCSSECDVVPAMKLHLKKNSKRMYILSSCKSIRVCKTIRKHSIKKTTKINQ